MKQILFILLAVLSFSSQAQIHINSFSDSSFYGVIKDNSDTFDIHQLGNIHFIKIGNDVFKITGETELKKVEPVSRFLTPVNDGNNYYFKSIPDYINTDTIDILRSNTIQPSIQANQGNILYYNNGSLKWEEQPKKKGKKK